MLNIDKFLIETQWDGRKPDCIQKILEKAEKKPKGDKHCMIKSGEYVNNDEKKKEFANLKYHYKKVFIHDFIDGKIYTDEKLYKGGVVALIEVITCGGIKPKGEDALKKLRNGNHDIWE